MRQRVLIRFSFLSRTTRAATEAQTRHTVPVGPTQTCLSSWGGMGGGTRVPVSHHVPLPGAVVPGRTAAEIAPVRVGAAELAGVLAVGALVDVRASAPSALLVVEAGGAEAAEAPQGVVTRRPPADLSIQALVLIWGAGSGGEENNNSSFQLVDSAKLT